MTRGSRRRLGLVLSFLVTLLGLVAVSSMPASAATSHASRHRGGVAYVALGDSYAAGFGGGDYLNECLQSPNGYPALLDASKKIRLKTNATCSGATTADVIGTQLSAVKGGTRLVTLTVGGNDLGFAAVFTACANGKTPACAQAIAAAQLQLTPQADGTSPLGRRLADTYLAVAAAGPKATILVTGYPVLFEAPNPAAPNAALIASLIGANVALNATIEASVAAVAETGVPIRYVDVAGPFAGHGIGSPDPWILAAGPAVLHPTATGYQAYAAALKTALPRCARHR